MGLYNRKKKSEVEETEKTVEKQPEEVIEIKPIIDEKYNQELYLELLRLRDGLRIEGKIKTGKSPRVCTDEVCMELAKLLPTKVSDLNTVPGVGKTFINNYGSEFINVILPYAINQGKITKNVALKTEAEVILQDLEKKLVNINRNNKLLYMPKVLNSKESFDLSLLSFHLDPMRIIFERGRRLNIAKQGMKGPDNKKIDYFNKLTQLQRNINRVKRDKGQNDLYIGYPFVEGRMPGERFDIKAPLVLFPVTLTRDMQSLDVKFDDSRDIVFNNTLILAYYKMNRIKKPLPDNVIDEVGRKEFLEKVINFYSEVGMKFIEDDPEEEIVPFISYRADEFPKYNAGELHIKKNIIIGRFPTYSSSIQKDFGKIIESHMVNPLLDDLLIGLDSNLKLDASNKDTPVEVSENDLIYINDLNSAQEEILSLIKKTDKLVIQGPPGTGKSQTITSLIADFANNEKTVLLVSEKKAALDVVYSRLGTLSKYTMLIDDVNNKDLFFRQMDNMTQISRPSNLSSPTTEEISNKIDICFSDLIRISNTIYQPGNFGLEPYRMYMMNDKLDPTDTEQLEKYAAYRNAFYDKMLDYDYPTIEGIYTKFKRSTMITDMNDCLDMRARHPWMMDLKGNLNEYEVEMAKSSLTSLRSEINSWRSSGFFSKILGKNKMKSQINDVFSKYWEYYSCHDPVTTYMEIDEFITGLNYYDDFMTLNNIYEELSDAEKMYLDVMHKLLMQDACSPNLINDDMFHFLLLQQIQKFETENKELLKSVDNFEIVQEELTELFNKKMEVAKGEIEFKLASQLKAITESKRFGEMQRVIELKRKWSVNKYIDKFDFELFRGIKIWLLTPDVVSEIIPLQSGLFDLVIFDEASQMFIEKGIPSIMRAKKVVIAGDHKQLRPSKLGAGRIGMDEDDLEDEDEDIPLIEEANSLLDVARFRYPGIMLKYHYRSKYEELISFSNHAFYKGRLYVSPNNRELDEPPIVVHRLDDGKWENRCNRAEAEKIVDLIKEIFRTRENNETIGVITFNSTQMDLIESMLETRCMEDSDFAVKYRNEVSRNENGQDVGLFVKNIENVQGDERDIIIFSIGYAKGESGRIVRNFGWLNQAGGENRLNVAISRAKLKIHIVTSFYPSELIVDDVKNDGPKLLKRYLEYCFAVSENNRVLASSILNGLDEVSITNDNSALDDKFCDQVYKDLLRAGFDVERNIGIGGYSIDMAIKKDGIYVLGLECDGRLYHSGLSTREREYHRRKYLESRGWKMHRIWSPSWWKSPQTEMDKISRILKSSS